MRSGLAPRPAPRPSSAQFAYPVQKRQIAVFSHHGHHGVMLSTAGGKLGLL